MQETISSQCDGTMLIEKRYMTDVVLSKTFKYCMETWNFKYLYYTSDVLEFRPPIWYKKAAHTTVQTTREQKLTSFKFVWHFLDIWSESCSAIYCNPPQENLIFCSSKAEYDFPRGDVTSTLERRKTNPHTTVSLKCWEFIRPDTVECAYLLPRCVSFWAWTSFCQELQHRVWGNKIEPLSKVVWFFF